MTNATTDAIQALLAEEAELEAEISRLQGLLDEAEAERNRSAVVGLQSLLGEAFEALANLGCPEEAADPDD